MTRIINNTTINNIADVTFGVEIECLVPVTGWNNRPIGAYHRGVAIADCPRFGGAFWKAERDCSVSTRRPNFVAVEIVSPILKGLEGINNVLEVLAWLRRMGACVNTTCGLHITVGFPIWDVKALRRLVHFVARHEDGIFASTGTKSRENGGYSRKVKNAFRPMEGMKSKRTMDGCYAARNRYHMLNLSHAIAGKERIEFRAFAGTLNDTKMRGYIQLVLGIVERAIFGKATAEYDAKPTKTVEGSLNGKGDGHKALFRLMNELYWVRRHGVRAQRFTRQGVMDSVETFEQFRDRLLALADKYDRS